MPPATPSTLPQSASAPTTRLRKRDSRNSIGRPLSSSTRLENGRWTAMSTPDMRIHRGHDWRQEALTENTRPSTNHANSVFEFKGNGTAKSSWLRRMSTLSSSRNGSPMSTPIPGSPSVSYSNGSTAPFLPEFADANPVTTHRNKLVKRSTSQRALGSTTTQGSTLRRPATSHQRSATLQQQYQHDERPALHATPRSSMLFHDLQEEDVSSDESIQSWQYLFRPKNVRLGKDGSSLARSAASSAHRSETLKTIVPDTAELPTLLLATSIRPRSARGMGKTEELTESNDYRLGTPAGLADEAEQPWTQDTSERRKTKATTDLEPRPRPSFSIADMFPSPSPSTWKLPRSGSLRRAKGSVGVSSGRRVVSAPQSTKPGRTRGMSHGKSNHGHLGRSKPTLTDDKNPPPIDVDPINTYGRAASSPLPPLNRLSAFEIELPGAAPSYPTTPQSEIPCSSPRLSSPPSPSMSSPLAPFSNRNRSYHPSLAISERGSTLLGSDNDTSRMLSGDEDDTDFRSDTVYDSTRTGATGSSHSNLRRLPIETMFDEPPISDHQKTKAIALQELLTHDSFNIIDVQRNRIAEEEESVVTPIRAAPSIEGNGTSTSAHTTVGTSLEEFRSPTAPPHRIDLKGDFKPSTEDISDEEMWAIESLSDSEKDCSREKRSSPGAVIRRSSKSPDLASHDASGQDLAPMFEGSSGTSLPNVSEWSESPPVDRVSSAPRPKTMQGKDARGSRTTDRRGPSALHLRSQSVPVAPENSNHRANTNKLEAWVLGNKGVSEDWDGDFEFEESTPAPKQALVEDGPIRTSISSGMLVPRSIMERQASVHGQFGHVKELTILVEELKLLRQQASTLNVMNGLSAELWKEADGIINLATLDDEEHDFLSPRSPTSPGLDFDPFEEDSPAIAGRRRSAASSSREQVSDAIDGSHGSRSPLHATPDRSRLDTPQNSRPRKESAAKAKSVLETIHQQRSHYSPKFLDERTSQKKLPFDTTSLRDLVTRAGVVTRALKEIVRRAEKAADGSSSWTPPNPPSDDDSTPPNPPSKPDPPLSKIFHPPNSPASMNKSPRVTQSPKGSSNSFRGATIAGNDNEINGHMKIMTVV
ncbi:MAG: hypothetical protein Q9166_000333 [cf. Caloplaca sp. 2 TL-2023]